MGRPFNGQVSDKSGKEDNVVIKRSIFRIVRKVFSKEEYEVVLGSESSEVLNKLSADDLKGV